MLSRDDAPPYPGVADTLPGALGMHLDLPDPVLPTCWLALSALQLYIVR